MWRERIGTGTGGAGDTTGCPVVQRVTPCSLLSEAQDSFGFTPAVQIGDTAIDFERLAESVEWLSADLRECGLRRGCRLGLAVRSNWEFTIASLASIDVDVTIVPVDPRDPESCWNAGELGIDYLLVHTEFDDVIEDVMDGLLGPGDPRAVYLIADVFTLVHTGTHSQSHPTGGMIHSATHGYVETMHHLLIDAHALATRLSLRPGSSVRLSDALDARASLVAILACARAGSCLHLDNDVTDSSAETICTEQFRLRDRLLHIAS